MAYIWILNYEADLKNIRQEQLKAIRLIVLKKLTAIKSYINCCTGVKQCELDHDLQGM